MVSAVIVADTPLSTGSLERRSDFFKVFGVWREIALSGMSIDEMVPALAAILVSPSDRESKLTFGELPGWDQAYLRFTARYLRMVDPEILAGMAGGTAGESGRYDLLGMLPQVKCPTLFLQGNPEMGALLAEEDLQQALELMPSAVSVRIDHAGHDIHLQDAAAALRAVTLFLESI